MTDSPHRSFSRRNWLGLVSTASVGSGLLAPAAFGAEGPVGPAGGPATDLGARIYNIRDFGAKGDGATLDTAAVQAAVDACARDQGGTVLVPAGVFVIGMVELKSNVTLHVAAHGTLLGAADGKQYHNVDAVPLRGDSTLGDGNVGLIYAVNAENVTVEGPGTIDGNGAQFRSPMRGAPTPAGISGAHRPYHLMFYRCKNLTVRNVFLKDCAFHSLRIVQCTFAWFAGIHLRSRVNSNNDGFHFISCQYVHVTDCDIHCQDDACALFGSCKFVTVANSTFSTRWSVFRFGGGVAENITVSNCLFYQVFGCPIKLECGGGSRFENMTFSNLVMKDVTGPISIGLRAGATGGGVVRNISFNGIHAVVAKPVQIDGTEYTSEYRPGEVFSCIGLSAVGGGFIENISFNDVHVVFPGGGTAEQAAVRDVPKVVGEYYAAGVFPAYALFARNVRGLTLNNVRFEMAAPDLRPAVVFDHVIDAAVLGLSVQGDKDAESALRFVDSQDVLLSAARLLKPAAVFLQVEGAENGNITVDGGDLSKADKPLAFKNGGLEKSVKLRT
jgi:hypothetical protein